MDLDKLQKYWQDRQERLFLAGEKSSFEVAKKLKANYKKCYNEIEKQINILFGKYANKVNSYNFSKVLNGVATIMNSELVNGNFKEWHTDLIMKAVPTLDEFLYHVIVDTTTAN